MVEIFKYFKHCATHQKNPKKEEGIIEHNQESIHKILATMFHNNHNQVFYRLINEIVRNKTFPNHQQKQDKQQNSQQPVVVQQQKKARRRGRKSKKIIEKEQKENVQKMQNDDQQQSQELEKQIQQKVINYRTRSGRPRNQPTKLLQNESQKSDQQKQSQSQSKNQDANKKNYPLRVPTKTKIINRNAPKKRGRPKKVIQQPQQLQSQQSRQQQSQNSQNKAPVQQPRQTLPVNDLRKTRLQRNISAKSNFQSKENQKQKASLQLSQKEQTSQQAKQLILQRVKFCLDKRAQLIQYLDELNITADMIKEILDLDVTTVMLQKGETTQQSIRVLQKLKSVLLHKYFPDDIKIRKKYEKLSKKAQSLKTNTPDNEQSLQDLELRKKTLIKLQKILRSIQNSSELKQRAIQIESHFRKYDEEIGTGYKTMAYRVLRSLKDKQYSIDQVIAKLQSGEYDQDK